jgi:hypothetical protein
MLGTENFKKQPSFGLQLFRTYQNTVENFALLSSFLQTVGFL